MSGSIHVMCTIEGPNPRFGYDPEKRKKKDCSPYAGHVLIQHTVSYECLG